MFVLGIDAGGTKTHCAIADKQGIIIGEGLAGPANHQTCGIETTVLSLREAIGKALRSAGTELADIEYAVLGMAGADGEDDYQILTPAVKEIMGTAPFEIVHDSWIGFRAAVRENVGVVSICGTGAGHSGQNGEGEKLTLRNLDYITGNLGGGNEIAQAALHFAFRSEEGTAEKTLLEERIPSLFAVETLDEVCSILKNQGIPKQQEFQLPILVFQLAHEGDPVAVRIISDMGYEEGRYAAAVIRRLHMEKERIPVVLVGSLFKTRDTLLIEPFMKAVHEAAADAYAVIPEAAPVTGAVALALEHIRA